MKSTAPEFEEFVQSATEWLMSEFIHWNETQGKLKELGYPNNHYDVEELLHIRNAFRAIAERFVLEDVDHTGWQWLETSWAGTDGNTGEEAYTIDFMATDPQQVGWGLLSFYVTRNEGFWVAMPSIEAMGTNSIQSAIERLPTSNEPN